MAPGSNDVGKHYFCWFLLVNMWLWFVSGKRSSELERKLPLQVLSHMYEIMIVLLALMLFCCMFIFICASMEEKTTGEHGSLRLRVCLLFLSSALSWAEGSSSCDSCYALLLPLHVHLYLCLRRLQMSKTEYVFYKFIFCILFNARVPKFPLKSTDGLNFF